MFALEDFQRRSSHHIMGDDVSRATKGVTNTMGKIKKMMNVTVATM
jgi:hypothetical protein